MKKGFACGLPQRLNSQQKWSDSVLHEARILFRQFATAQCPAKKAGAAGLLSSSQAILSQYSRFKNEQTVEMKSEDSIFYVVGKKWPEMIVKLPNAKVVTFKYEQTIDQLVKGLKMQLDERAKASRDKPSHKNKF